MKALITKTEYKKEVPSKFGTLYSHAVHYDGKTAFYTAKSRRSLFLAKKPSLQRRKEPTRGKTEQRGSS